MSLNFITKPLIDCSKSSNAITNDELHDLLQHSTEQLHEAQLELDQAQQKIDRISATINWAWSLVDLSRHGNSND